MIVQLVGSELLARLMIAGTQDGRIETSPLMAAPLEMRDLPATAFDRRNKFRKNETDQKNV